MAQPTPFISTVDFSDEEANGVAGRSTVRTAALDGLFDAIEDTLEETLANLALIQRDDGNLLDGVVKIHTLSSEVRALLSSESFVVRGTWVTATAYAVGDVVVRTGIVYLAMVAHTSGTFATDLSAEKWGPLTATQTATDTPFSPTTSLDSTNVQAAITELDGDLRAPINILKQQQFNGL